jgi:hypothetical protein
LQKKHNEVIYSRFEYYVGDVPAWQIFEEYNQMFDNIHEDGVQISGAQAAINLDTKTAIVLTYSKEADNFLRLKFNNRPDVKFHDCRPKKKEE